MVSKTIINKLNAQLNLEFYSSNIYLQISAWCESKGLPGSAAFLFQQAQEELEHMQKIYAYIHDVGGMAVIGKIDAPATDYKSLGSIFKKIYDHECHVTKKIHELTAAAWEAKDFATYNFLQWFVDEQVEEESQFQGILDKIKLIGDQDRGLYLIDAELGRMSVQTPE